MLVDGLTAEELLKEVDRRNDAAIAKIELKLELERGALRDEIVDDVLKTLREKGVFDTCGPITQSELRSHINKSSWSIRGDRSVKIPGADEVILQTIRECSGNSATEKGAGLGREGGEVGRSDQRREGDEDDKHEQDGEGKRQTDGVIVLEDFCTKDVGGYSDEGERIGGDSDVGEKGGDVAGDHVEDVDREEDDGEGDDVGGEDGEEEDGEEDDVGGEDGEEDDVQGEDGEEDDGDEDVGEEDDVGGEDREEDDGEEDDGEVDPQKHVEDAQLSTVHGDERKKRKPCNELEELTPLPAKRARTKTRRFGFSSGCSKEKAPDPESEAQAYITFRPVEARIKKKFLAKLASYRKKEYVVDGHRVKSNFFECIYKPQNWVDSSHVEAMLTILWRRLGESFLQSRVAVLDTWFSHTLALDYNRYQKTKKKSTFVWHSLIKNYIRGVVPTRSARMAWYTDIDTVYVPLNWGKGHWVAAAIDLRLGHVFILDPLIIKNDKRKLPRHMKPIVEMLPIAIKEIVKKESLTCPVPKVFSYERVIDVYQNDRTGDCGPLTVKFIELHAQGLGLDGLTDETVDEMRMRFAVDVYDEFVVSLRG